MSAHPAALGLSTDDLPFFFEDRHHALADHLRAVAPAIGEEHDPARVARAMGEAHDLYIWLMPADGRVDVRALCLIREALGQVNATADAIFAVQGLGTYPILLAGDATREQTLEQARRGELICGFGLTEPGAGSDVKAMAATATKTGDGWHLQGEKTFISNVGIAQQYVVFAKSDGQVSAFVVPSEACTETTIPMSLDHPIGRLELDCQVGDDALLGEVGRGLSLALGTLGTFRVSVAAAAVGMSRRALSESLAYAKQRRQFGKPIAAQQFIQGYLAEMATELDAARLLTYRAAWAKDVTGSRATREVSEAKLFATEAAQRIIDRAVQIHGGLGVTRGTPVEALYREIRPLRIYEGTTEIQKLIIARELTDESK